MMAQKGKIRLLITSILFASLLLTLSFGSVAQGEVLDTNNGAMLQGNKEKLDIVFLVDCSGSMKSNDSEFLALEMIQSFISLIDGESIRVAYAAYNDQIIQSVPLQNLNLEEQKDGLTQIVGKTEYSGETDIGLALKHGTELAQPTDRNNTVVILLSDGETDLRRSKTGRTLEESAQDVNNSVAYCNDNEIPIHTIAFGKSYSGSKTLLEEVASKTNGSSYEAKKPDALIKIFYDVIQKEAGLDIIPVSESVYSKGAQNIRCNIQSNYYQYLTCFLVSDQEINAVNITCNQETVPVNSSKYFSGGKIELSGNNIPLDILFDINTKEGQELNIYLIGNRNMEGIMKLPKTVEAGDPVDTDIYFINGRTREVIQDISLYEGFDVECNIYRKSDNSKVNTELLQLTNSTEGIRKSFSLEEKGEYIVEVFLSDAIERYLFETTEIKVVNTGPQGEFKERFIYPWTHREDGCDLNEYFYRTSSSEDANHNLLSYQILKVEGDSVEPNLIDNHLDWKTKGIGDTKVHILITDKYGDSLETVALITIYPLWRYYPGVAIGVLVVVIMIAVYFFTRPRKCLDSDTSNLSQDNFSGKLNAYFTKLPEGLEIKPFVLRLYQLKEIKISMEKLTDNSEIIELFDLKNIYVSSGKDRGIILRNKSKSSIMIGNSVISNNVDYHVLFGSVIYIMTEDDYELEIHYISVIK